MGTIKNGFENDLVDYEEVKNPREAINNIGKIMQAKYDSILDKYNQITSLNFTKTLRLFTKIFGTAGVIVLTFVCQSFTKDIIASGSCFTALSILEVSLLKGTKSNKTIDEEIESINLDIQNEFLEIDELFKEKCNLLKLAFTRYNDMGQVTDTTETHQVIAPIKAYPEVKSNPRRRERVPEKNNNNPNNSQ